MCSKQSEVDGNRSQATVPFWKVFLEELTYIQHRRKKLYESRQTQEEARRDRVKLQIDAVTPESIPPEAEAFEWADDIDLSVSAAGVFREQSDEIAEIVIDEKLETRSGEEHDSKECNASGNSDHENSDHDKFIELRKAAFEADLCGLAISGGGVRAATFGLGVLQGLAKEKMLSRFDYLSTVSGGGYIGGFLSAWIRKDGIERVEEALAAGARSPDSTGNRCDSQDASFIRPLKHLRKYSNHLTPTPGIFSYDGWSLLAIYTRNLLLNQITIVLLGLAVFGVLRTMVEAFSFCEPPKLQGQLATMGLPAAIAANLLFAVFLLWQMRKFFDAVGPQRKDTGVSEFAKLGLLQIKRCKLLVLLFHALAIGLCIALVAFGGFLLKTFVVTLVSASFFTLSYINTNDTIHPRTRWRNLLKGEFPLLVRRFLPGWVGGLLLMLLLSQFDKAWQMVVWGVPLAMLCNLLSVWLMVGWLGDVFTEADREWWGTLSSRMAIAATIWTALFCFTVFSPVVFGWGYEKLFVEWTWDLSGATGVISSLLGVIGTMTAGLYAASSLSVGKRQNRFMSLVAHVAPYLFLFIVFFGICIFWTWGIYYFYDQCQVLETNRGFMETLLANKWYFVSDLSSWHGFPLSEMPGMVQAIWPSIPWLGTLHQVPAIIPLGLATAFLFFFARRVATRVGINRFSLQRMYSTRLGRCYLGAQRTRSPAKLTNIDMGDDFLLHELLKTGQPEHEKHVPLQIFNGALNMQSRPTEAQLDTQDRKSDSFFMTPLHCGSNVTEYVPTKEFGDSISTSLAMGISGAAVSSNMGFRSTPAMSVLLTLFNLRLGWWFPRPGSNKPLNADKSLELLIQEMAGVGAQGDVINVSDGGHFENMGVYELIRRGCRFIICIDADSRPDLHENIGRVVRMARIDFNALIDIDADDLTPVEGMCNAHFVVGRIHYDNDRSPHDPNFDEEKKQGVIIWISLAMTGDEPEDLQQYQVQTNQFPYAPTFPDQFFSEDQFESYRELGAHSVANLFAGITVVDSDVNDDKAGIEIEKEISGQRQDRIWKGVKQMEVVPGPPKKKQGVKDTVQRTLHCEITYQHTEPKSHREQMAQIDLRQRLNHRSIFKQLHQRWMPLPPKLLEGYVVQNKEYMSILATLRSEPTLARLAHQLYGIGTYETNDQQAISELERSRAERLMAAQMMTLLENVWFSLDCQQFLAHPVNEGWKNVFLHWVKDPTIQKHWNEQIHTEFSPVFRGFVKSIQDQQPT